MDLELIAFVLSILGTIIAAAILLCVALCAFGLVNFFNAQRRPRKKEGGE